MLSILLSYVSAYYIKAIIIGILKHVGTCLCKLYNNIHIISIISIAPKRPSSY